MKFYDYIESNKDKVIDIYFDMDGVLAEYDVGNFDYSTIRPIETVINAMKELYIKYNVKILSVCITNKIVEDKYIWLDKYMPFFDPDDAIFLSKEEREGIDSKDLKSDYLKKKKKSNHVTIMVDDDSSVIKTIRKNNEDVKIFHVSSLIK